MIGLATSQPNTSILTPAVRRLNALTALDADAIEALRAALVRVRAYHPPHELLVEGRKITETLLFLDGWAARVRNLPDGRRAIMNFLLPGDLIGNCDYDHPVAASTVVALTRVVVCPAPPRGQSPALDRAYKLSRATEEAYLLAQITRLSRLNAHDRLADLLLELLERLDVAGLAPN
ncbi:cyclic nucleotide-binding domain-containing protein, partial [Phenylobacterium sp.]|uniref:cyclic nucleotide-binding domain-containing protein n=1 Tax=Phenylobacterium sp. TaxID=1871053 RepID=UPI0025E7A77C